MKKTKWFPSNVKPVRIGVYETRLSFSDRTGYSWWDGFKWGLQLGLPEQAEDLRKWPGALQNKSWRGMLK